MLDREYIYTLLPFRSVWCISLALCVISVFSALFGRSVFANAGKDTSRRAKPIVGANVRGGSGGSASLVYFLNKRNGWALCFGGRLCRTTDGGLSWRVIGGDRLRHCREFAFSSETVGWALNDEWREGQLTSVLRTTDGGHLWSEVFRASTPLYGISNVRNEIVYVRGRWQGLYRTIDRGASWEDMLALPQSIGVLEGLRNVFFFDDKRGVGYGHAIWLTEDGGKSWQELVANDLVGGVLYSASFRGDRLGWAVGTGGQVWKLSDGHIWKLISLGADVSSWTNSGTRLSPPDLCFVHFTNDMIGWVLDEDGRLFRSSDGGNRWAYVSQHRSHLWRVWFLDPRLGWGVDIEKNLFRTSDGGTTWHLQSVSTDSSPRLQPGPQARLIIVDQKHRVGLRAERITTGRSRSRTFTFRTTTRSVGIR